MAGCEAADDSQTPSHSRILLAPAAPRVHALEAKGGTPWRFNSSWHLLHRQQRLSSCCEVWTKEENTRVFKSFLSHSTAGTSQVWESSVACALLLAAMPAGWLSEAGSLLELGSGVGLGGGAAAELRDHLGLDQILLSDCQSSLVELLRRRRGESEGVVELDWNKEEEVKAASSMAEGVMACDCVYYHPDMLALLRAAAPGGLLQPKLGLFLAPQHRSCFQEFRRHLRKKAEEEGQHWCSFEVKLEGRHDFLPRPSETILGSLSGSLDRENRTSMTRVSGFMFSSSFKVIHELKTRLTEGDARNV
ncbi:hypothetical protein GUITHDRAFT_106677 [Guillardia theta CCMP2712]|uniref:Calmodulin-lysine N-methyltransferase n=1 Tax=Guillardia theta (strain CCMP2712) TaxID=905079 RepID=L1JHW8_GUITC|nr:hypothetical protein GUITHDRAFT_106677 [Guillardia theta CCMP2712]EKX47690.1 hypothetical protein GUITHDRAFT_106677 [Guillardia theta CCMP2712]|eukprot:XP_005834670.1 hypothetical protein GUITHDRAFT_106677 [Guillardia theta CCMP2712]